MSRGYRTPLGRVRGLGAAKHGVSDFISVRVTGAALVPLGLWGVYAALKMRGAVGWFNPANFVHNPFNAILLSLLIAVGAIHMRKGMVDVILDYIHRPSTKALLLTLNLFAAWLVGAAGVFSVLKIGFFSGSAQ